MASFSIRPSANPNLSKVSTPKPEISTERFKLPKNRRQKPQDGHSLLYKSYFHRVSSFCKDGQIREAVDLVNEMELRNLHVGPEIFGELLQGCLYKRDLLTGQQIHARILKNGSLCARNEYIETKLVIFYAKCDALDVASLLFCRLRTPNVFSWAAIIGLKCRLGFSEEAVIDFIEMLQNGLLPDNFVVPNACKACGALGWIGFGRGVHGYVLKAGLDDCMYVASSLIDMYGKCCVLKDARKVFDDMPDRNVITWNSLIVGYVQNGMDYEAIQIFLDTRSQGVEPTRISVSSLLSASANLNVIDVGKQGHAIAIVSGLELDSILGSSILNFYCKVGMIEYADLVFDLMVDKDVVTWNLLISGYIQQLLVKDALYMCRCMRSENLNYDCVTLSSMMAAAADTRDINLGKEGHCYCIRNNLDSDVVLASSMVNMYAKCEKMDYARTFFDSTSQKDVVLWNTLLAAYAELGRSAEALRLFYQMQLEGVQPNVVSWNSTILGFFRNGQVEEAKNMFLEMQSSGINPNVITWTTIVSGLVENGLSEEAIFFFRRMQKCGITPNTYSIVTALSACSDLASLHSGRSIHGYIIRHEYTMSVLTATSLIEMYAKCGDLTIAKRVFGELSIKELPIYNAMISAFALHGKAEEALQLYKKLKETGINPDCITFTNILSACNHAGMVNEATVIFFEDMVSRFNCQPTIEHYGSMVNLLSRCGKLDKALELIAAMPVQADSQMIGSLLVSCSGKERSEILQEQLSRMLLELEPNNPGNHVMLSNAHAVEARWDEVSKVRRLMKEQGLKKSPGCSWVQIDQDIHVFVAGDIGHQQTNEIGRMLGLLRWEMCLDD